MTKLMGKKSLKKHMHFSKPANITMQVMHVNKFNNFLGQKLHLTKIIINQMLLPNRSNL